MKPTIIAFTGMPLTGKSTARGIMQELLSEHEIEQTYVHFGSTEEVERRNSVGEWPDEQKDWSMEQKEKMLREQWRAELGMGAMALKKLPEIKSAVAAGKVVLIDNLYSDEERAVVTEEFGEGSLLMVATVADWNIRVFRASKRQYRPLSESELKERDRSEVYKLNKSPTIALAEVTMANNSDDLSELKKQLSDRVLPIVL